MRASPRIVVYEPSGAWAAALRWQLRTKRPLVESREFAEAEQLVAEVPGSLLLGEVSDPSAELILQRLLRERTSDTGRATIVLLSPSWRQRADWFWEAGALFCVLSPRRLDRLIGVIERHAARARPAEPLTRASLRRRLPW